MSEVCLFEATCSALGRLRQERDALREELKLQLYVWTLADADNAALREENERLKALFDGPSDGRPMPEQIDDLHVAVVEWEGKQRYCMPGRGEAGARYKADATPCVNTIIRIVPVRLVEVE